MNNFKLDSLDDDIPLVIVEGERREYPLTKKGRQDCFIDLIYAGHCVATAARRMGIARATPYTWFDGDAQFKERYENARKRNVNVVVDALYLTALKGNVRAQEFFLCNKAPGLWQHVARIEHMITPETFMRPAPELQNLSTDDLLRLREIAQRINNVPGKRIIDTNATEIKPAPQRKHGDNGSNGTGDSGSPDPKP